jgi:hypothetical protein
MAAKNETSALTEDGTCEIFDCSIDTRWSIRNAEISALVPARWDASREKDRRAMKSSLL